MEGFRLVEGICHDCKYFLPGCYRCHFEGDKPVCDECYYNYDITDDKTCISNQKGCNSGYYLDQDSNCVPCPENCRSCYYDKKVICFVDYYWVRWEEKKGIYSCIKCNNFQALIEDLDTNIKYCYERRNQLIHCLEGKMKVPSPKDDPRYRQNPGQNPPDSFFYNCTKCINNSHFNNTNTCICNYDSFDKGVWVWSDYLYGYFCYKCNDPMEGNVGCEAEKGCTYAYRNDH